MRLGARRFAIGFVPFSLLLVWLYGCPPRSQSPGEQLLEAGRGAGVEVHPEEVFTLARGDESITASPIKGWETIPATELRNGVNIAFAHFGIAEPKVPAGYYTLKAFADPTGVGTVEARVQLIDGQGGVAAELPALAEIHSMTVPEQARSQRSFITTGPAGQGRTVIWFRCPNGVCIRFQTLRPRVF